MSVRDMKSFPRFSGGRFVVRSMVGVRRRAHLAFDERVHFISASVTVAVPCRSRVRRAQGGLCLLPWVSGATSTELRAAGRFCDVDRTRGGGSCPEGRSHTSDGYQYLPPYAKSEGLLFEPESILVREFTSCGAHPRASINPFWSKSAIGDF
ncbi:hypothetical protein EVAR_42376_1 [Eumeta japonica]|uniref:Uncharacterized protein n=1 Tax=Eumeta variegata TaxID=151549 RepID=A0A4C1YIP0_EUMVA|nr:hypothetical protein EVAR_42376_1 [Eumeta japonica]